MPARASTAFAVRFTYTLSIGWSKRAQSWLLINVKELAPCTGKKSAAGVGFRASG
jgi:hypothetical protein